MRPEVVTEVTSPASAAAATSSSSRMPASVSPSITSACPCAARATYSMSSAG